MGHVARKRFGQHFLTDKSVIGAIIDAIAPGENEAMVEIGPGLGAMTLPLLAQLPASSQPLTVVELDRDLAARLRKRGDLTVIESDVLKVDFGALATERGQSLRVVGNLPYNISSPILFHLLQFVDQVVDQTFMLQKEVVDRMASGPGSKDYGRLSVMLQWRYQVDALFDVPPEAFDPPPRVNSAIVRMIPHAQPASLDEALLSEMVASAFSQRRKLLRHSLGRWLEARGFQGEFDLQRRAEEVPVQEFVALAQSL
ncbi:16S rRNA (adenine(1518)-N(6)/adenine(1519)-N(6))-dimethyltransferase RsmA [Roseateles amylovorans]|jgi:16S rRNA (adenine1518-N6/adenine1519-N6)-dimethyltransferase|uniref:Ribosomal RNA small subunit methyltransferase A n=1 Tax=Roseateles amylovorans TaxID=2978473 RepID=A0ABY6AZH5_9BURK|nr:16S rRNA (adenine(1518)-N(6)/adenine(1519)-N(6))-dimethyltransferase RsmA [Roseateles amylovorans]UXH78092.1 16S rRNA (adenine(1518)-N(6)/adenine(1519)-N(6))-dimethyltransferase RsmA [Roseateles amylovorans]